MECLWPNTQRPSRRLARHVSSNPTTALLEKHYSFTNKITQQASRDLPASHPPHRFLHSQPRAGRSRNQEQRQRSPRRILLHVVWRQEQRGVGAEQSGDASPGQRSGSFCKGCRCQRRRESGQEAEQDFQRHLWIQEGGQGG